MYVLFIPIHIYWYCHIYQYFSYIGINMCISNILVIYIYIYDLLYQYIYIYILLSFTNIIVLLKLIHIYTNTPTLGAWNRGWRSKFSESLPSPSTGRFSSWADGHGEAAWKSHSLPRENEIIMISKRKKTWI